MKKFGKLELCLCLKGDKYDGLRKALERCESVDEDYARLLGVLFLDQGDNPNCTCNDVEDDPHYMNFLANTKLDGTSYVSKVNDQNGLPVFIKYEKDRELCLCLKGDKYDGLRKALERCESVDEDYARLLRVLFLGEEANPNCTCNDVEDDPYYMNFLANTKLDGTSYVSKVNDQNGLPVFIKYEKDRELEIHGVVKDQDNVREKYKLGESSKDLKANARENRSVFIVEKQKMKDGILSKKRGNEDRELEIHGVENGQDNVRAKHELGRSSKALKSNARKNRMEDGILSKKRGNEDRHFDDRKHRIDVKIVPGKEQKMQDRILSKNRGNKDRDLDNRNQRIDVKTIPGKEQNTQNGSKFMDAGVNIEPKEHSDSLEEGRGSSSYPFVPSVEHRQNLDATTIDFAYRKEVLNLLMRPYNEEEYKKLWKDIKMQLPSSSTNGSGKSLLSRHKAVNRAIKRTNHDKDKKLNIMRGFFFWLEHLTRQDAFQPWEDAECLQMMPGSS
ncbi:uncharacterized protein LOC129904414 isoform X2 [Solanum dulcamara]|uniref:uncharacterized protein LOC129904414 isoform X2 n=1 Tax=Solanum dulcamara TaxID=45834 RepID=UPI0024861ABB|nr:uncharacterized protein LOC129904414 isoform X2 [Solanum dulcamara]